MSEPEKMVVRIDKMLSTPGSKTRYGVDDERVLRYIRKQITPEGQSARKAASDDERYSSIGHLLECAKQRLKPYESEGT